MSQNKNIGFDKNDYKYIHKYDENDSNSSDDESEEHHLNNEVDGDHNTYYDYNGHNNEYDDMLYELYELIQDRVSHMCVPLLDTRVYDPLSNGFRASHLSTFLSRYNNKFLDFS